jgi:hypothetical protein
MHVHVHTTRGQAKFWIEPAIELAQNYGLTDPDLTITERLIREHQDEIRKAWKAHFGS